MKENKNDLVWADAIEDIEEVLEDDIEINKTADVDGDEWLILYKLLSSDLHFLNLLYFHTFIFHY